MKDRTLNLLCGALATVEVLLVLYMGLIITDYGSCGVCLRGTVMP